MEDEVSVPGAWLELDKHNPAGAKRIRKSSEVLKRLGELQEVVARKDKPIPWIKTPQADVLFACVIVAYALLMGVDVEIEVRPIAIGQDMQLVLLAGQSAFCAVFLLELFLRVRADGPRYVLPSNPLGCFDTCIILVGLVELAVSFAGYHSVGGPLAVAGPMRMLRLLRLVRLVRLVMVCKQLRLLFAGMLSSISTVFWAFTLLSMLMYLGALFCVILLGKRPELQEYFGTVGLGLFTHFQIVTLEAWPDISDAVIEASGPQWGLYFVLFICVSSLALMNLVTGVVCEKLIGISKDDNNSVQEADQLEAFRESRDEFKTQLQEIFERCDMDGSNTIDSEEFTKMLDIPDMVKLLENMDISSDLAGSQLFEILDDRHEGALTSDKMADALLRLRGSRTRLHSMMLQRDFVRANRRQTEQIAKLEEHIRKQTGADLLALEHSFDDQLNALSRCVEQREEKHRTLVVAKGEALKADQKKQQNSKEQLARWNDKAARLERLLGDLQDLRGGTAELLRSPQCPTYSARGVQTGSDEGSRGSDEEDDERVALAHARWPGGVPQLLDDGLDSLPLDTQRSSTASDSGGGGGHHDVNCEGNGRARASKKDNSSMWCL